MIGVLRRRCAERAERAEVAALYERHVLDTAAATLAVADAALVVDRRRWFTSAPPPCEEVARGALAMASLAAAELGVPVPGLFWFKPETSRERAYREQYGPFETGAFGYILADGHTDLLGVCMPRTAAPRIGVLVGQTALKTLTTVAHEVAHLGADSSEVAARRFERSWLHRLPQWKPEWIAERDEWLAREIAQQETNAHA